MSHHPDWRVLLANPGHPIWGVARTVGLLATLLVAQILTSTSYDLDGEFVAWIVVGIGKTLEETLGRRRQP